MRGRKLRLFGSASYRGRTQGVTLEVQYGAPTPEVEVTYQESQARDDIRVKAHVTGQERRFEVIEKCLELLRAHYERVTAGDPPAELLVVAWHTALHQAWTRALLN